MNTFLAQSEAEDVIAEQIDQVLADAPTSAGEALTVVGDKFESLWTGFLQSLPIILIGLIVFVVAYFIAVTISKGFSRGLEKTKTDPVVGGLLTRIIRSVLVFIAIMFSLSVMGVPVANAVTFLAVMGFAVGLAIQGILENFVAGIILLLRKPFRAGDQVITGDYEGTVEDIDFRVTTIIAYDGTKQLIPNGEVYSNPIVNLTSEGKRRTTVTVGVDYRDDHLAARDVILGSLDGIEGILPEPAADVLLYELGDSSVNYEVRYWTLPDISTVRHTQARVLGAVKSGIEGAGMSIPWPIRTLVMDGSVQVERTAP